MHERVGEGELPNRFLRRHQQCGDITQLGDKPVSANRSMASISTNTETIVNRNTNSNTNTNTNTKEDNKPVQKAEAWKDNMQPGDNPIQSNQRDQKVQNQK